MSRASSSAQTIPSSPSVSAEAADDKPHRKARSPGRLIRLAAAIDHILDHPEIGLDEIGVFIALASHVDDGGDCFPSQSTIATYLHRSRPWVNARIAHMVSLGLVERKRHRLDKGGETSCRYHLPLLAPPSSAPVLRQPGDTACQPLDTRCHPADTNLFHPDLSTHRQKDRSQPVVTVSNEVSSSARQQPVADQSLPTVVVNLEIEAVIRRIQRASTGPWRMETAKAATLDAIARAGLEQVRALAENVTGAGLKGWEIGRKLAALSSPSSSTKAPQPHVAAVSRPLEPAPIPLPLPSTNTTPFALPDLARITRLAIIRMNGDVSTQLRWHRRAEAAGISASLHEREAWVSAIAFDYFEEEHPNEASKLGILGRFGT